VDRLALRGQIAPNTFFTSLKESSMTRLKTRTLRYELRLTPVEKESWSLKASALGLDLSEYIRRCVERRQITTTIQPEVNRLTAVELGKIGVNLNQLQRAMNTAIASDQNIPNLEESLAVVKKVYEAVRTLQGELLFRDRESASARIPQKNKAPGSTPGENHFVPVES
jgi:hypothetical protein